MAIGGSWRYVKVKKKLLPTGTNTHWAEKKKLEAVTVYIACGSPSLTAEQTNIPFYTIKSWMKTDWWKDKIKELQQEDYDKLDNKMSKALDLALDNVMDRINNGEYFYDVRTGKIRRIPAKLRDINTTFTQLLDKRQLIRKQPTKIVEQQTTANQLKELANKFSEFVSGKKHVEKFDELVETVIEGENVFQNEDGTWELRDKDET